MEASLRVKGFFMASRPRKVIVLLKALVLRMVLSRSKRLRAMYIRI